jgi:hypothetical protein
MKAVAIAIGIAVLLFAGGEAVARFVLGLGDPPLTIRDPDIEYLFAPNRCYHRFGNRVCYNAWSMRSDDLPAAKADGERRVLVLGDSVINGGATTDQADLATEILKKRLGIVVGNVSAGSWGPANLLAYLKRFGSFDADELVFVFSAHDLTDLPLFEPDLGPDFPETTPPFALWEAATRYLPRYLGVGTVSSTNSGPRPAVDKAAEGRKVASELLAFARSMAPSLCVVFHHDRETIGKTPSEEIAFGEIATAAGARFVSGIETASDYRDFIHLNAAGQTALADTIEKGCLRHE